MNLNLNSLVPLPGSGTWAGSDEAYGKRCSPAKQKRDMQRWVQHQQRGSVTSHAAQCSLPPSSSSTSALRNEHTSTNPNLNLQSDTASVNSANAASGMAATTSTSSFEISAHISNRDNLASLTSFVINEAQVQEAVEAATAHVAKRMKAKFERLYAEKGNQMEDALNKRAVQLELAYNKKVEQMRISMQQQIQQLVEQVECMEASSNSGRDFKLN
eukprot:gnl/MRDRNA2_/MRDRNA2_230852_c0_seq1.p1 gnl/MRDRNA2_/MRDRNA2_230852_c0~~gnl/MRDRNA2_/MRDRNA2_230852_c0_seq1.p1  ORF type:complete len:215 (-),score=38.95 gnl/MRDRNA2_/MRDRNA2_230852_c0_seq1:77-721(-)